MDRAKAGRMYRDIHVEAKGLERDVYIWTC